MFPALDQVRKALGGAKPRLPNETLMDRKKSENE